MVRSGIWTARKKRNMKKGREWRGRWLVSFPESLKKRIKNRDGSWSRIHGYHYFPGQLKGLPFNLKRNLCLPRPECQANDDHCLHHALIKSLESRIRIARWRLDPRHDTPRLSIQHAIDITAPPLNDPDHVFTFLGIPDYVYPPVAPFAPDDIGVTTANNWPYRAPDDIDPPNLPLPRDVPTWERFRLDDVVIYDREYNRSDPKFEDLINSLILELKSRGPFVASFRVRTTHQDARYIFKREGDIRYASKGVPLTHAVTITGWKKWRKDGELRGYWQYLDSYGLGEGHIGFGRIAFDAVDTVEVPIPLI